MALEQTRTVSGPFIVQTEFGPVEISAPDVSFPNIYIKVEAVVCAKDSASAEVSFSYDGKKNGARIFKFTPDLEGPNFIAQAYAHLKTLPEFTNAVDC